MDIQKRKFSKKFTLFFLILLFITACSSKKELILEDFKNEITAGMTSDQVKKKLGEPERIEKDNVKAIAQRQKDAETSIDMWPSEDENFYENFFGGEKEETRYLEKLRKKSDTSYYQYQYTENKNDEKDFFIYFIDDQVVWMSFP